MNKNISTYNELVQEKERLEARLNAQKELLYQDVQDIKEQLQPARDVISFIGKITTKDRSNLLLNVGSDMLINGVVRRFILAKAGWLGKTIIPYFMRNYSSHIISEQKDKWLHKLTSWLGHKNGKHKHAPPKEASDKDDVF